MLVFKHLLPVLKEENMGTNLKGRELGEGISQRKDGRYQARYTDRFGKRKTIYANNVETVRKKLADAEYENRKELNVVNEDTTLDEWFNRWMKVYKAPYIRKNTKIRYSTVYVKHISPTIGNIILTKITRLQIQGIINDLDENGYQWETQNKVRMMLGDMFSCAMADQFVNRNPCKGVRCIAKKPDEEPRFLTRDEQALFFEYCAGTWYDNLFNVAINTGLRPGELAALTWDDIDIGNSVICVNHTLVYQKFEEDEKKMYHLEDTKTTQSNRTVPINENCMKYLKRQYVQKNILDRRMPNYTGFGDFLFVTRRNNPINATDYSHAIRNILMGINERLDDLEKIENFSGHTFRHTFATRCIESGMRPKTLQKILGHASLKTTMDMYVHVDDDAKQEQMRLLVNQFEPWENAEKTFEREAKLVNIR